MVNDGYDSFIDPASWPDEEKRERHGKIFGFSSATSTEVSWARRATQTRSGPRVAKAPPG